MSQKWDPFYERGWHKTGPGKRRIWVNPKLLLGLFKNLFGEHDSGSKIPGNFKAQNIGKKVVPEGPNLTEKKSTNPPQDAKTG